MCVRVCSVFSASHKPHTVSYAVNPAPGATLSITKTGDCFACGDCQDGTPVEVTYNYEICNNSPDPSMGMIACSLDDNILGDLKAVDPRIIDPETGNAFDFTATDCGNTGDPLFGGSVRAISVSRQVLLFLAARKFKMHLNVPYFSPATVFDDSTIIPRSAAHSPSK